MAINQNLKQFYFCYECKDFYEENGIRIDFETYLTSSINSNLGNCPRGHIRTINKEDMVFMLEKPNKAENSSLICLDIKGFSEKNEIAQFNNASILHTLCQTLISEKFNDAIYKGTGDGFIIGLPSTGVSQAIEFCKSLIEDHLNQIDFIKYRIGIEYGIFFYYEDLMQRKDFLGKSVTDVTRIADFGNNNNILLSEEAANNLKESCNKKENLIELGFCFDKHKKPAPEDAHIAG